MTKYVIHGGKPLYGEIDISGAKNAAVAIIPAALLVDENPGSAAFFHERYEELRNLHLARLPARPERIRDLYGGVEYGGFSRW